MNVPSTSHDPPQSDEDQISYNDAYIYESLGGCDLCVLDDMRLFYLHHATRSTHWEPPWAAWACRLGLPYGWEQAVNKDGIVYYIDHTRRRTTYQDPRRIMPETEKRQITIYRDPVKGYGFVAAGQQPTIIQFVSPGGPSEGKLFAHDEILEIDGVDVSNEPKDEIVDRIRAADDMVTMTVQQMRNEPRRQRCVRFTDSVQISSPDSPGLPPPLPNVLRVFLENGQTRSFKFDEGTTVQDVVNSICEKLCINASVHFALCVEYNLGARSSRISLLLPDSCVASITELPNAAHLRCVFRFVFLPPDTNQLIQTDPQAFDYFYNQCVNDVVQGRFTYEIRYEACIRLAALQIQQICYSAGCCFREGHVSLKKIEKEFGLNVFLPAILLDNVKRREVRRHLRYYLRRDDPMIDKNASPSEKALFARLKYVQIVSHLPSFSARVFSVTLRETHADVVTQLEMLIQVEPNVGILLRCPGSTKNGQPAISIAFDMLEGIKTWTDSPILSEICILLADNSVNGSSGVELLVDKDETADLIMLICGYYQLATGTSLSCVTIEPPEPSVDSTPINIEELGDPPPYRAVHTVVPAGWNYSVRASNSRDELKVVDFTLNPPSYEVANSFPEALNASSSASAEDIASTSKEDSSSEARKLLKATDSLLIKNSQELHLKEATSPMLKRKSNPAGIKVDPFSDSSDTEGSSRASPSRLPRDLSALSGLSTLSEISSPTHSLHRNGSVETLMHVMPHQNGVGSAALVSDFNIIDLTTLTPSDEKCGFKAITNDTSTGAIRRIPSKSNSGRDLYTSLKASTPSSGGAAGPNGAVTYMSRQMNLDRAGIEDFLRRSNSICDQADDAVIEQVPVRRMSLKEYTGVESERVSYKEIENPLWKESTTSAALLTQCSRRRRSLLSNDTPPTGSMQKLSVQVEEALSLKVAKERIVCLQNRAQDALKHTTGDNGKHETAHWEDLKKKFANHAKALELASQQLLKIHDEEERDAAATEVYELAKSVVDIGEELITHGDVFHAKLLQEEIDQALLSIHTVFSELEEHRTSASMPKLAVRLAQLCHAAEEL